MYAIHFYSSILRREVPAIRRMNSACYAVLKTTCDSEQIRRARNKNEKFKQMFIPAAMLWSTSHFQSKNWIEDDMDIFVYFFSYTYTKVPFSAW